MYEKLIWNGNEIVSINNQSRGVAGIATDETEEFAEELVRRYNEFPQWMPIDTAPRDGTEIIISVQHWNTKGRRNVFVKFVDEDDCEWRTVDDNSEISYDWTPTHWMPKPVDIIE